MKQYLIDARRITAAALRDSGIRHYDQYLKGGAYHAFLAEQKEEALRALGWSAEEVVELPTSEVTSWILKPREAVDRDLVFDCPATLSVPWRCYLGRVVEWWKGRAAKVPYPLTIHHGYDRTYDVFEPGRLHLCFGSGHAKYWHRAAVDDRWIRYQQGHLWLGELGPEHTGSHQILERVLDQYVPRVLGEPWWDESEHTWLIPSHQLQPLKRKPYVQSGSFSWRDDRTAHPCLNIVSSRRALLRDERNGVYDVGEVRIVVPLHKERTIAGIGFYSLSSHKGRHPHSNLSGGACWGSCGSEVRSHLAAGDYPALLDILWLFINSHDPRMGLQEFGLSCYC